MTKRLPSAAAVAALALIAAWVLRGLLAGGGDRVPGLDAPIHLGWETVTRLALGSGRLPFWDPYVYAGTPHLADVQTQVFYPPALMLRWLPPIAFLTWMVALHLWIGGVGGFFLARTIGTTRAASLAAALAIMLGGSVAPWLYHGHFLIICSTAWMPWVLALAIRSARRGTRLPHPALVAALVLQVLAGFPQGFAYTAALVAAYFLFSIAWPDPQAGHAMRGRVASQLVALGLLVAGLAAFQLLPFLMLATQAGRGAGVPYSVAVQDGWALHNLSMVFFPFEGGGMPEPYRLMLDGVYAGWLLTLLTPLAFADRTHRRIAVFLAVVAVVAVAFALSTTLPLYRLHYALFPGFRVPGRLLVLATPGLAMLGAIGLDRFVGLAAARRWRPLLVPVAIGLAALSLAFIALSLTAAPRRALMHGPAAMPLLLLAGVAVTGVVARWAGSRAAAAFAVVVVATDVGTFAAGGVNAVPVDEPGALTEWLGPADGGRLWSTCANVVGSAQLTVVRRPALDGPGGVALRDYTDWLELLPSGTADAAVVAPAGRAMLDAANATTIVSCEPLRAAGLTFVRQRYPVFVYRNSSAWPRAFWTCAAPQLPRREIVDQLRRGGTIGTSAAEFVNVRWSAAIDDAGRRALEARYHLSDGTLREGTTWRYVLRDASPSNTRAIVSDPAVEDTSGIDRAAGTWVAGGDPRSAAIETMVTRHDCGVDAAVQVRIADQPDGRVDVDVEAPQAGTLFLSEPHYTERRAFVDGTEADVQNVNLAFTAVRVPAGRHHVSLRIVPRSLQAGSAISLATCLIWVGAARLRRRPPAKAPHACLDSSRPDTMRDA